MRPYNARICGLGCFSNFHDGHLKSKGSLTVKGFLSNYLISTTKFISECSFAVFFF